MTSALTDAQSSNGIHLFNEGERLRLLATVTVFKSEFENLMSLSRDNKRPVSNYANYYDWDAESTLNIPAHKLIRYVANCVWHFGITGWTANCINDNITSHQDYCFEDTEHTYSFRFLSTDIFAWVVYDQRLWNLSAKYFDNFFFQKIIWNK